MLNPIRQELRQLNREGLLRNPRIISALNGAQVKIQRKWYISFCSNDYLGLAQHPELKRAMIQATHEFGAGAGAARLLSGTTKLHQSLEHAIARFKHADDALIFTSGYAANLGVITALIKKNDTLLCDELNHASLVDSTRLTKAALRIYRHCDIGHLESLLSAAARLGRCKTKSKTYIITDAIFSMDGDGAPLKEIIRLAKKYNAYTIVDEAHGTGVFGKNGHGWCEHLGLENKINIIIGTASKALGSIGGFVAGPQALIDYVRNKSRPFIFTTALPPGSCAATLAALSILRRKPELRQRLWNNAAYLKNRLAQIEFDLRNSVSPIIPILIGHTGKTVAISQALWNKGIYAPAIRPPTVPQGQSRLRLTVTAMHTKQQLDALIKELRHRV